MDSVALLVDGYRGASAAALCACLYDERDRWLASEAASTGLNAGLTLRTCENSRSESAVAVEWEGTMPEWVRVADVEARLSAGGDTNRRAAEILSTAFRALGIDAEDWAQGRNVAWLVACAAWFASRGGIPVYCVRLVGRPEWKRSLDNADGPMLDPSEIGLFSSVPIVLRPDSPVKGDLVALLKSVASFEPPPLMFSDVRLGEDAMGLGMAVYVANRAGEGPAPLVSRGLLGPQHESTHCLVETNIDDMNPEWATHLIPRLLDVGADDAYLTPVHMKKGRLGLMLSVLCAKERLAAIERVIYRETTSIGLRYHEVWKRALAREFVTVQTPYGPVRVKVAYHDGAVVNRAPEYEEARRAAEAAGVSVKEVYEAVYQALGDTTA
ncbi:nickel insertion protein [Alicyclobacillus sendaiensis]|uniref:DUF111 family protein n=1 Tax=Alicyclobacillus sendaiensis PA2 TaxID=3029425 RepID=A0ABT6XUG6_ALISE|nr:nickel insertion protein [Alicyclobacillus sendaiensis]MDI9258706.1 DUF111 family protein [Alicyclobacillus sendaiensis PA2]